VLLVDGESTQTSYHNLDQALLQTDTSLRLFGKPEVAGRRRMGVGLARAESVDAAREKARAVVEAIRVEL